MRILIGCIVAFLLASVGVYFALAPERPWMAFYFACCGGVIALNLLITLFFVNKNVKNK